MTETLEAIRGLLTDDELAALEESNAEEAGTEDGAQADSTQADEGAATGDDGAGQGDDGADDGDDTAASADDGDTAKEEEENGAADDEAKTRDGGTRAHEALPDLKPLQDTLADLNTKRKDLQQQYNDGDITDEDYETQTEELFDQISDAKADLKVAQGAYEAVDTDWKTAARAYLDEYPDLTKSEEVLTAFDQATRYVTSNPAFRNLSFKEQLARAHAQLEFDAKNSGLKGVPPLAKRDPVTAPKTEQKAKEEPPQKKQEDEGDDMRTPPPTLAQVPASDAGGVGDDGTFANLTRLADQDPVAYEAALSKLSDEQQEAYLQSAV